MPTAATVGTVIITPFTSQMHVFLKRIHAHLRLKSRSLLLEVTLIASPPRRLKWFSLFACVFLSGGALDARSHLCHLQNCSLHVGKTHKTQHRKVWRLGETDEITAACRAHTCTERVWMNDSPFRGNMSVWEINGRWLVNDTMGNMIHYCLPLRYLPQQTHTDQHISAPTSRTSSFPHLTLLISRVRPENSTFNQMGGRPFAVR